MGKDEVHVPLVAGTAVPLPAAVPLTAELAEASTTVQTRSTTIYEVRSDGRTTVSWLGNFLWIWFAGGAVVAAVYAVVGVLLICTIVGIPIGFQLLKIADLALFPFGKRVAPLASSERGWVTALNVVGNILFTPIGIMLMVIHAVMAVLCVLSCWGIPFALQHLKLMQLAVCPFGRYGTADDVTRVNLTTTTHTTTDYGAVPSLYPIAPVATTNKA